MARNVWVIGAESAREEVNALLNKGCHLMNTSTGYRSGKRHLILCFEDEARAPTRPKTYVEFSFPGTFFSESSIKEVETRDPRAIAIPDGAFAFYFYDQYDEEVTTSWGQKQRIRSPQINRSKKFYPNSRAFTAEQLLAAYPERDFHILLSNMKSNGFSQVIETRMGNFQPFDPEKDEVLTLG